MKRLTNERGAVLLVAIIGIIVAGSLVTALVSATVMDHREGRATNNMGQAFAAAEDGLNQMIGNWNAGTYNGLTVGDSVTQTGSTPNGTGSYSTSIKRLNNELFIVNSTGNDARTGARQSVGAFVKLRLLEMDIQAALTTRGAMKIGGNAEISALDEAPSNWSGCPADSDLAGLRIQDLSEVSTSGNKCKNLGCVDGAPTVQEDGTISDSTFFQYGDQDWAGLTAMATKVLPGGNYQNLGPAFQGGLCDVSVQKNFGDPINPTSACGSYLPIAYVAGNATFNTGYGQGILLVEGDLSVQGGFEFYGIVIVRGVLKTAGQGGHFNGAVMAANVDLDDQKVIGSALIQYSQCAVQKALNSAGSGAQLRSRGWLYTY